VGRELPIGALSEQTGVHVETIRYYERIGMMPAPPRSMGGHRLYLPEHRQRLMFIRRARELGFTLDEIRALLGLVSGGPYSCAEVRELALGHLKRIRAKLADLRSMERTLAATAARCDGGQVPECPIINALSESGREKDKPPLGRPSQDEPAARHQPLSQAGGRNRTRGG
jgi:MerR family transcriptional regulator, mercuric resistance operon regulatory protein